MVCSKINRKMMLIILAGVLINISLGNNGLFNKAKTAKEMYVNAQVQEEIDIAKMTNSIDGYVGGNRDYETEINTLKSKIQQLENINSYSADEKVIGTYIDDTVYKKTFTGTTPNSSASLIDISTLNIKQIINGYGFVKHNNTQQIPFGFTNYYSTGCDFISMFYNNGTIQYRSSSAYYNEPFILTIEYTKTAD